MSISNVTTDCRKDSEKSSLGATKMTRNKPFSDDDEKNSDDEDDEDATATLMNSGKQNPKCVYRPKKSNTNGNGNGQKPNLLIAIVITVLSILFVRNISSSSSTSSKNGIRRDEHGTILFDCPSSYIDETINAMEGENFEEDYTSISRDITTNKTEFLASFRTTEFDGWGESYSTIKRGSKKFKKQYYTKYLKEGSHLYESACGIGLNLFMTLEIVGEENISGITVYGNEFVPESVEKARTVVLADGVIPGGNKQGTVCAGDSSNLGHVPKEAFDVVYSGYVTPLMDPLMLKVDDPDLDTEYEYGSICDAFLRFRDGKYKNKEKKKDDWMGNYLWEVIDQKQRDWYGRWVGEMTRIAKPGAPVIVEQVSIPYCFDTSDWGGVSRDFWQKAAREDTYHWNVDPDSIEMADDMIHDDRYHVVMLKHK